MACLLGAFAAPAFAGMFSIWAAGGLNPSPGYLAHSSDGGATWEDRTPSAANVIVDVDFVDAQIGWVALQILPTRTTDGGATSQLYSGPAVTPGFVAVGIDFVDANQGWGVGPEGGIVHTNDGGISWTLQRSGGALLTEISMADSLRGWAVGDPNINGLGRIFYTADGGATWVNQTLAANISDGFVDVAAVSTTEAWVTMNGSGNAGKLLHTTDAGTTWNLVDTGAGFLTLNYLDFLDAQYGWAVAGNTNKVVRTTDGGQTWSVHSIGSGPGRGGYDLMFADAQNGWLGSLNGVYYSSNGGVTWTRQFASSGLRRIAVTSSGAGSPAVILEPSSFVLAGVGVTTVFGCRGGAAARAPKGRQKHDARPECLDFDSTATGSGRDFPRLLWRG